MRFSTPVKVGVVLIGLGILSMAFVVDRGWNLRGDDIVWTRDYVGIGISSPTAGLDVKRGSKFRGHVIMQKNLTAFGTVRVDDGGDGTGQMTMFNRQEYAHPSFADPQVFGTGGHPFFVTSIEGVSETSGVFGDGNMAAIWSPGDGAGGISGVVAILDEDRWNDDTNPYNGTALIAYINNAGTWVASDINRKQNIEPLFGATEALMHINGYTYEYKLVPEEIAKGQQPRRVAGLIAQEVNEVLPEAVEISDSGEYFINLTTVTPLLVEALKDQVILNQDNVARIETLEQQNQALMDRLAALEAMLGNR